MNVSIEQSLQQVENQINRVFTLDDLRVLFAAYSDSGLFKVIQKLERQGGLQKIMRGLYARPGADLLRICQQIAPEAYISCGTALAKHLLIGSIPKKQVYAVRVGSPKTYRTPAGQVRVFSIKPELCFGFSIVDGIKLADPEKAYLDAWYFQFKGATLSFDPGEDVFPEDLNRSRLQKYLAAYDARFVTYFKSNGGPV